MTLPQEKNRAGIELHAENLQVAYKDFIALNIEELTLEGRVIAIIGHNGSGKSTLIKTMLQLLAPRRGSINLKWRHVNGSRELLVPEEHMAFSPENGAVFADITVRNYVELWCRIKQGNPNYYKTNTGAGVIERLHVDSLLNKLGRELSKGQRRRVQIAVGFLTRPRLFLFDEPFDGLDVQQANELGQVMADAAKEMALFVSSHRMDVVERLSDQVIVLKQGSILTAGSLEKVCADLCDRSLVITLPEQSHVHIEEIVQTLRQKYPEILVHHLGSQIVITGTDLNSQHLTATLNQHNGSVVQLEEVRPSLIDAMNFHLKQFASEEAARKISVNS